MSHIGRPPCDAGAILHGPAATSCAASARRWTLIAAVLGSSMAFVDGTVVNVALPAMQRDLHATASQMQWVIEVYALFLAALLLVGGALGDRFGRRRVFMIGVAVFTLGSIACALSTSAFAVIAARAVQGVGAALLVPGSLALLSATFPADERGGAIGSWSAFSGIAAAGGPVLGGYLVEHWSWTWAFLVNVPVGIALLAICALKVPESRGAQGEAEVDRRGALLATLGLAGLVYALIEAAAHGWARPAVGIALVVGVAGLIAFARVEARVAAPMLPLTLFKSHDFSGANVLTLLLYAALGGGLYFLPLNLIQIQGYGATSAGAAMLPFIAIMFALSGWAGGLVDRVGARMPLIVGPLIAAAGFGLLAMQADGGSYWRDVFPGVCVLGLGMAVTVAPLTTTVMNAVEPGLAGAASGVNNAVSRAGGLIAVAAFGIVMATAFDAELLARLAGLQITQEVSASLAAQRDKLGGMTVPAGIDDATGAQIRAAIAAAFVAGYRQVLIGCVALSLASALSAWWMIDRRRIQRDRPAAS